MSGRAALDPERLVWVVQLQGESQSARIMAAPEGAPQQYKYAVVVLDADTGGFIASGRRFEPLDLDDIEPPPQDRRPEADPTQPPVAPRDTAGLAASPEVVSVIIGHVVQRVGEEVVPSAGAADSDVYAYWRVRVDQHLVEPLPHGEITLRFTEVSIRDGEPFPTRFRKILEPGEDAVFFLTRPPGTPDPPVDGEIFSAALGPGHLDGVRPIRDGRVELQEPGTARQPLEEFIDRVISAAQDAGRTVSR